jgi:hypothetical protein
MFEITTEPERKLVRLKISGMLTLNDVAELYRQEHEAIRGMGCPVGQHVVIVDVTDCPLQLQTIVSAFQESMNSPGKARRLAMVIGSSLGRIQARRILTREDAALFNCAADAEAWLFPSQLSRAA